MRVLVYISGADWRRVNNYCADWPTIFYKNKSKSGLLGWVKKISPDVHFDLDVFWRKKKKYCNFLKMHDFLPCWSIFAASWGNPECIRSDRWERGQPRIESRTSGKTHWPGKKINDKSWENRIFFDVAKFGRKYYGGENQQLLNVAAFYYG